MTLCASVLSGPGFTQPIGLSPYDLRVSSPLTRPALPLGWVPDSSLSLHLPLGSLSEPGFKNLLVKEPQVDITPSPSL